jgi:hypothetical protein
MTTRGGSPGYRPRTAGGGRHDDLNALTRDGGDPGDEARVKATWYLVRTGNADLLQMLGLVADPVAEQARKAKALVETGQRPWSKRAATPGSCPLCGNRLPKSGVCRKTLRCREVAARKEVEEQ